MKREIVTIIGAGLLLCYGLPGFGQSSKAAQKKDSKMQTMTWTTKSPQAKELATNGSKHLMNVEREQAFNDLSAAVKLDPDFTVALVFLSNLTRGEARKAYAARAIKSSMNKTEGEKLFASLTDEKMTQEMNRDTWAKLHTMFPDGEMIGHYYVVTRATPEERFNAAENYIKQFPAVPSMYNTIAYYYMNDKKDNAMAKQHFDKYMSMYPDGTNPYDSMAEFYLNTGDNANSEKYYRMALEKYPFYTSAIEALQKINDAKPKTEVK
ncbi:MAG: hypothetical protein ABIT07_06930 [Ferruginibacter sp.]